MTNLTLMGPSNAKKRKSNFLKAVKAKGISLTYRKSESPVRVHCE